MREVVFRVIHERPGHVEARADRESITITAPSLEELHYEAREALIEHLGPAHGTVRVRIRRNHPNAEHAIAPRRQKTLPGARGALVRKH